MQAISPLTAGVRRYRELDIEYAALRVVGRGLFLAVMLMVGFLYVFMRVTDLVADANEVIVPTVTLASDIDIGALAAGAFSRTSGSVVSVLGVLTLMVSALLTAHALRNGTRRALLGSDAPRTRLLSAGTLLLAIGLPTLGFATWLLTLATAMRRAAWVELIGQPIDSAVVDAGKAVAIILALALVGGSAAIVIRVTSGRLSTWSLAMCGAVAVVVVAANFFLLYTYVGALINPAVSAGIVLILTLLLWVNVVSRAYLGAMCMIAARASGTVVRV